MEGVSVFGCLEIMRVGQNTDTIIRSAFLKPPVNIICGPTHTCHWPVSALNILNHSIMLFSTPEKFILGTDMSEIKPFMNTCF